MQILQLIMVLCKHNETWFVESLQNASLWIKSRKFESNNFIRQEYFMRNDTARPALSAGHVLFIAEKLLLTSNQNYFLYLISFTLKYLPILIFKTHTTLIITICVLCICVHACACVRTLIYITRIYWYLIKTFECFTNIFRSVTITKPGLIISYKFNYML